MKTKKKTMKTNWMAEEFGMYYENLKVNSWCDPKDVEGFKRFWSVQYGDADVEIPDEIFKMFLETYKGDFRETAEQLHEFCSLDMDHPDYDEITGDIWI